MTFMTKSRAHKGVNVLAAAAVALAVTLAAPADAIATAGSLKAQPSALLAGEKVVLSGAVAPKLKRPVILQRKSGSSWLKVAQKSSTSKGAFAFTTTARDRTTKYRVYAPAATISGRRRAAAATPLRTVTTLTQTALLTLPATAVLGSTSTAAATFTPVRAGRPLTLELLEAGGVWTPYGAATQSTTGHATFPITHDEPGTFSFRAVAHAWKGAAEEISSVRTLVVDAPRDTTPPSDTTPPGPVTSVTVTGATTSSLTTHLDQPHRRRLHRRDDPPIRRHHPTGQRPPPARWSPTKPPRPPATRTPASLRARPTPTPSSPTTRCPTTRPRPPRRGRPRPRPTPHAPGPVTSVTVTGATTVVPHHSPGPTPPTPTTPA